MERCVALRGEAVFTSPLQDVSADALRAMGIPVVECADYMEPHPLGRAEWMKFFGLLFDCSRVADSLYAAVEADYRALAAQAAEQTERPRLMLDLPQGGTWYVPGGQSYLGTLLHDAGADYAFAADTHAGSIALGRECGLLEARRADVWLIRQAKAANHTYSSLKREDPLFATFRPWKERRIFVCNTLRCDFFERIPFQPHVLLRELVDLLRKDGGVPAADAYFQPLEE
jgi:iron complex transport system substrate-binding protein